MTRTISAPGPDDTGADDEVEVRLDGLGPELAELREAIAKHKHYKRLRERLEKRFKDRLGDAQVGTIDNVPVISYRETERTAVSLTTLEQRYPEIADECRATATVRTFLLL